MVDDMFTGTTLLFGGGATDVFGQRPAITISL